MTADCSGYRATSCKSYLDDILRRRALSALYFILSLSLPADQSTSGQHQELRPLVTRQAGKSMRREMGETEKGGGEMPPPPPFPQTSLPSLTPTNPKKEAGIGEKSRGQSLLKFS